VVREDVTGVLLSVDRQWWDGDTTRQWRGGIAAEIGRALDSGMSTAVVTEALNAWGDPIAQDGKVILNVQRALRVMRTDVRLGLACIVCGRSEVLAGTGHCAQHLPVEDTDLGSTENDDAALPLAQRVKIYLGMGMSARGISEIDPEAARELDRTRRGADACRQALRAGRGQTSPDVQASPAGPTSAPEDLDEVERVRETAQECHAAARSTRRSGSHHAGDEVLIPRTAPSQGAQQCRAGKAEAHARDRRTEVDRAGLDGGVVHAPAGPATRPGSPTLLDLGLCRRVGRFRMCWDGRPVARPR